MQLYYILIKFNYEKYRSRKYHAIIDTGANISVAKYNVLPPELWKKKPRPVPMASAGQEIYMIELEATNIDIQIGNYELKIPKINQFNEANSDVILGLDFLENYMPLHMTKKALILTTPCNHQA